mmetsp:Transcript_35676/g.63484  ORF Transcript_35676/g.63484 Transcript_35676/m.63484 type:complete len:283 (+) Transcript_35676:1633-2481(+)
MCDSVGLRASIPVVWLLIRWAYQMVAICWPACGPIQNCLDAYGLDGWDEVECIFHAVHETLNVALKQMVCELWRHLPVPVVGHELSQVLVLIGTNQHAISLIAQVVRALQIPENWQLVPVLLMVLFYLWHRLCNHILVLQDNSGRVHSSHFTDASCPKPSAVDDPLCVNDVRLSSGDHRDLPRAVGQALQTSHFSVLVDFSTHFSGFRRKGLRHRGGIYVAVALCPKTRHEAICVHQRVVLLGLFWTNQVQLRATEETLVEFGLGQSVLRLLQALLILNEPH